MSGVIAVVGRQGAGKGTQCAMLARRYEGVVHLSTGDVLRESASAGGVAARRVADMMAKGDLVPDELMCEVVAARLEEWLPSGVTVLLDGFPRTPTQAEALAEMAGEDLLRGAVVLDVDTGEASERMLARGRGDDTATGIARRLELYESQTEPLLDWFDDRGLLRRVDGVGEPEEVFGRLAEAVAGLVPLRLAG